MRPVNPWYITPRLPCIQWNDNAIGSTNTPSPVHTSFTAMSSASMHTHASQSPAARPMATDTDAAPMSSRSLTRMSLLFQIGLEHVVPCRREPLFTVLGRRRPRRLARARKLIGLRQEKREPFRQRLGVHVRAHPAVDLVRHELRQVAARHDDRRHTRDLGLEHDIAEGFPLLRPARTAVYAGAAH